YDSVLQQAQQAVLEAVPPDGGGLSEDERTRARIAAFVHACVDAPRVARVGCLEATGLSPQVESHRRAAHHRFAVFIESFATPLVAGGRLPERNYHRGALAVVGA